MSILRLCFAVLAAIAGGNFVSSTGHAQTPPSGPAYVVGYVEVSASSKASARAVLRALRDASRKEPGNTGFDVFQRIDRPQQFVVLESWKDIKAQTDHAAAAGTKQSMEKLKPHLVAPYDERPSFGFMVGATKAPNARSVIAVTHVDFVGAKKDDGLAALKQLGTDSAKEAGLQRFDIWQQTSRVNHITLIEGWSGMSTLEAHEKAAPSRKFRDALLPIGGALFDQRLYRVVD